eukprot:CAMPEP_0183298918 /NCGR_PEP_ID=MMETSP0160_2-20130417/5796_1 /TAXON_ID=2839 ORGANISM="Odontella Sinensis, Strain Grunow 1884" /NCGR_SAMPLE_ID=MMETSP0160_2 /ASSEMBLY_ACC=CAM_ASM_000250 /LENGTH=151 /DNA_ID=CAMNT_0025461047 /DNA_START=54 /DNA_END=506 /DNA_ORIENTATION=-
MTTAHRPTWKAAVGRAQEGGWSAGGSVSTLSSVRDVASHTKLKLRKGHQTVPSDRRAVLAESLRKLEEAERSRKRALLLGGPGGAGPLGRREMDEKEEEQSRMKLLTHTADVDEGEVRRKYDDDDENYDDDAAGGGGGGWSDLEDDDGRGG